jgi:hypothetical protein
MFPTYYYDGYNSSSYDNDDIFLWNDELAAEFGVPQEAYAQPAAPPTTTTTTSSQIPLSEPAKQIIADAQTQCPPNQNIS